MAIWNVSDLELDGRFVFADLTGKLARNEALAELGAAYRPLRLGEAGTDPAGARLPDSPRLTVSVQYVYALGR